MGVIVDKLKEARTAIQHFEEHKLPFGINTWPKTEFQPHTNLSKLVQCNVVGALAWHGTHSHNPFNLRWLVDTDNGSVAIQSPTFLAQEGEEETVPDIIEEVIGVEYADAELLSGIDMPSLIYNYMFEGKEYETPDQTLYIIECLIVHYETEERFIETNRKSFVESREDMIYGC